MERKKKQEKLMGLVSKTDTQLVKAMRERVRNKAMLKESKKIAMQILFKLRANKMTQTELAEKMKVSPQFVSKLLAGTENLTLETIVKIQQALDIAILVSYKINNEHEGFSPILYSVKTTVSENAQISIDPSMMHESYLA
jgi:transcriptional regulator with XRE-family HTH domain